ncbi:MAG TPA: DinB family protein [Thermomicrobiales bacterium]|nr:DinB family protein [Thermomicrobiales bacterium]
MTTRAQQFAAQFQAANAELIAAVEGCNADQWRQATADDGRSVAVVAHHVASVNGAFADMVTRMASGDTVTPAISIDEVHRMNAEHAIEYANVEQADVLDLARSTGDAMYQMLQSLPDDRLDAEAGVFGGNPLTVSQVIEYVVVGHTAEHTATIRATLG